MPVSGPGLPGRPVLAAAFRGDRQHVLQEPPDDAEFRVVECLHRRHHLVAEAEFRPSWPPSQPGVAWRPARAASSRWWR